MGLRTRAVGMRGSAHRRAAAAAQVALGAAAAFTDYAAMLRDGGLQAVVIGTPMPFHVAQAVQALEAGVHVLCEVTAGVSVAESATDARVIQTPLGIHQSRSAIQNMLRGV